MQPRINEHAEGERPRRGARRLLRDYEVAEEIGISVNTLRADRIHARRIPFIKLGRSVWYEIDQALAALQHFRVGGGARTRGTPTTVPARGGQPRASKRTQKRTR